MAEICRNVCSVLYYVRSYKHIEALWFANTANSLLWWTYVKAFWRALNSVFGEKIKFKTTLKGRLSQVLLFLEDKWFPIGSCWTQNGGPESFLSYSVPRNARYHSIFVEITY